MISNLHAKHPVIINNHPSKPYINSSAQSSGMVRYNGNMQCLEVYDGSYWQPFSGMPEIGLTPDAEAAIEWVKKKMLEEKRIDALCQQYPGLRKARDNYETFLRLVESQDSISNN
jgi:hypothetical protein